MSILKVRLVERIPSENIGIEPQKIDEKWKAGGAVDTSTETTRRLINLGRKDARNALAEAGLVKEGGR